MFNLQKMQVELAKPVLYRMQMGQEIVDLNACIGKKLLLKYHGVIHCVHCGEITKKSFYQGYCYSCGQRLAACDFCVLAPHLCHYHQGTCREPDWGQEHCMKEHYVYLANTSWVKVGLTRCDQKPNRFIDQGAIAALPILKVSTRKMAGFVERLLSSVLHDKTNWRQMLKGEIGDVDLPALRQQLFFQFGEQLDQMENDFFPEEMTFLENEDVISIHYPVEQYPAKIKALNLDKESLFEGVLLGIKGQYLIFDQAVFNVRNHTGYQISIQYI